MWNSILKPAVVLFLVCALVGGALAGAYAMTKDTIDERIRLAEEQARKEALKDADTFEEVDLAKDFPVEVESAFKGIKDGNVVGYVFSVTSKGYGGDLKLTVGLNTDGKITGVKLGEHNETPGLGSRAEEPSFTDQFLGFIPKRELEVVKTESSNDEDIQAISGATITSRGVTGGVQAAIDAMKLLVKEGN